MTRGGHSGRRWLISSPSQRHVHVNPHPGNEFGWTWYRDYLGERESEKAAGGDPVELNSEARLSTWWGEPAHQFYRGSDRLSSLTDRER